MKSRKSMIQHCLKTCIFSPKNEWVEVFAPANLAMIKYWGKRDVELNLPVTSSLSISLKDKGTRMKIRPLAHKGLVLWINGKEILETHPIYLRLKKYLDDFPFSRRIGLEIHTISNIPIGAGLASSSSAFAAMVMALDQLFEWQLDLKTLSILARMGSGSAARSFSDGFVIWHQGERMDGMDSYAEPLSAKWDEIKIGLLILESGEKPIGSTEAMIRTVETSKLYQKWPQKIDEDLKAIQAAIETKDFISFGKIAEENASFMHQTMADAYPPISYATEKTIQTIAKVKQLRKQGLPVFFTQDAGPNIKLIYEHKHFSEIKKHFQEILEV